MRRETLFPFAFTVLTVFFAALFPALAEEPPGEFVLGELLVKFKSSGSAKADQAIQSIGAKLRERLPRIDVARLKLPQGLSVEGGMAKLKKLPFVEYVEPNHIKKLYWAPRDSRWDEQWGMRKIQIAGAWGVETGESRVVIAIVDTGVDLEHPDLKARIVAGYDFVSDDKRPSDPVGHGTHCAGIAAASANNNEGIAGVCPNCSIMPIRVLDDWGGKASNIAKGIVWAADHGAKVISLSLGAPNYSSTEKDAVDYAVAQGCLVVASAGNSGTTAPIYPASLAECLAVGASDKSDGRVSFSQYGSWVAVAAPGTQIMSTVPGGYAHKGGTSMATPFVSGLAGLLFSRPGAKADMVRRTIEQTCDPAGSWTAHGRINAKRALAAVAGDKPGQGGGPPQNAGSGQGGQREAAPNGYSMTKGKVLASPGNSLVSSDDKHLRLTSKGAGLKAVLDFYVSTRITGLGSLELLEIKLEGALSDSGEMTAYLYDWKAKSWTWIGKAQLGAGDTAVVFGRKQPKKYVSSDGSIRVRFYREAGRWNGFELSADRVRFVARGKAPGGGGKDNPTEQAVSKAWKKLKSLVK